MNLGVKIILIFLFSGLITKIYSQDPEFTQFYANPLYLNPAFAGTNYGPRFCINYRNQWTGVSNSFVTYSASYDQHFDALSGGLGFQLTYDKAGIGELTSTSGNFIYSYNLNISKKFTIKTALQASVMQRSIDFNKLSFTDEIHPRFGFINTTEEPLLAHGNYKTDPRLDMSVGFMGFSKKFYAGFAVHHINEPTYTFLENSLSKIPRKYTTHVGMLIPLENIRNPNVFFSPNILFQKQGSFVQFNIGGYYINKNIMTGLWFRQTFVNTDAFLILFGLNKGHFKAGYSYDIIFSEARLGTHGSHEISVIIELEVFDDTPTNRWKKIICPSF